MIRSFFKRVRGEKRGKTEKRVVRKEIVCKHCYDATSFVTKAKGSRVFLEPVDPIVPLEKINEKYKSCTTYGGLRRKFPIIAAFSAIEKVRVWRYAEE